MTQGRPAEGKSGEKADPSRHPARFGGGGAVPFHPLSAVFYGQTVERTFSELKIYMNVYEAGYASLPPDEEQAQALSEELGGARVTFLSETGEVLADTGGAEDNHVTREEVQQALLTARGRACVPAPPCANPCSTIAAPLSWGDTLLLVRLAVPARSGLAIFAESLPTVVWFLVVDILCCLFVAWLATSFVLRPVEQLTQEAALSGGKEVRTKYAELAPIAQMINLMNADLHEKVEKMNEDRRLEKLILNSIEHGIVIFRDLRTVILINRTAKRCSITRSTNPFPALSTTARSSPCWKRAKMPLLSEKSTDVITVSGSRSTKNRAFCSSRTSRKRRRRPFQKTILSPTSRTR